MKTPVQLAYDHTCKQSIGNTSLLAYLLKHVVQEYHDLSVEEILPLIEQGNTSHIFPRNNATVNEINEKNEYNLFSTTKGHAEHDTVL